MNIWKRICYGLYMFVFVICFGYVIGTLLFKFGFYENPPSIQSNLSTPITFSIFCGVFFKIMKLRKKDIYFLIILIVLTIGCYFFILN
ncbi:hypothetical protein ACDQ54_06810 [Fusobacterium animalis]|mgnify:FL=1|uniref:hypothetical protein n=1 Tax=Fusobacterium animalis TaxID=76859 RepID=UPI0035569930